MTPRRRLPGLDGPLPVARRSTGRLSVSRAGRSSALFAGPVGMSCSPMRADPTGPPWEHRPQPDGPPGPDSAVAVETGGDPQQEQQDEEGAATCEVGAQALVVAA